MVPLQIADARQPPASSGQGRSAAALDASSGGGALGCSPAEHNTKELGRLKRERAYLLERVQAQCRQFDRRAEGIRAHFDGRLKEKDVQLQHLATSLADANGTNSELSRRLVECEGIVQQLRSAAMKTKADTDKVRCR
jgi:hypothetical protein